MARLGCKDRGLLSRSDTAGNKVWYDGSGMTGKSEGLAVSLRGPRPGSFTKRQKLNSRKADSFPNVITTELTSWSKNS
jgi:hypothetical protein